MSVLIAFFIGILVGVFIRYCRELVSGIKRFNEQKTWNDIRPVEKLEKIIRDADMQGKNIIICYDEEDGFWIGERDRRLLDPTPIEYEAENDTLIKAIEVAWKTKLEKAK